MIVSFRIVPLSDDQKLMDCLTDKALEFLESSNLPHRLSTLGIFVVGEWGEIVTLIRECHKFVRRVYTPIVTVLKIEEDSEWEDVRRQKKDEAHQVINRLQERDFDVRFSSLN